MYIISIDYFLWLFSVQSSVLSATLRPKLHIVYSVYQLCHTRRLARRSDPTIHVSTRRLLDRPLIFPLLIQYNTMENLRSKTDNLVVAVCHVMHTFNKQQNKGY